MKFGVLYDMRNPAQPDWHIPWPQFYGEAFDHMEAVDRLGFESIGFCEHHGDPDGYNPSIIGSMTAASLRTKRARIGSNIIVLPQHHPVRLAEDLAVVDIVSGGRLDLGVGPGGPFDMEYRMLGINPKHKPSRLEEATEIILRAWTEDEPFTYRGKRFEFEDVWINPKPLQKPPPVFMTAPLADAAMDRVIRLGVGVGALGSSFFGPADRDSWIDWVGRWTARCEDNGVHPREYRSSSFATCFVTEDPEKAWAEHRKAHLHLLSYERQGVRPYAGFLGLDNLTEPEQLPGWEYVFVTPEQAIEAFRHAYHDGAPDEVQLMARRASMSWEQSLEHLRLFKEKVEPALRDLPRIGEA
ncbi:MAG TPA: LLM class flavin-dependent oxidoreductase [Baekduia sp.]|nr:LLM class flavin-dependent oxidoreductase [Baekduia sp.]